MWDGKAQTPKTPKAYRAIDVQPSVTRMLKAHLAGRQNGLLFLSKRNTPLRNSLVVGKQLHPLLDTLGIPRGGMHAFRHFRVSFLVQHETPFEVIRRWIGHGADEMIRRDTHLHPTYRKQVMARIPAVVAAIDSTPERAVLN
jgi:integrase